MLYSLGTSQTHKYSESPIKNKQGPSAIHNESLNMLYSLGTSQTHTQGAKIVQWLFSSQWNRHLLSLSHQLHIWAYAYYYI